MALKLAGRFVNAVANACLLMVVFALAGCGKGIPKPATETKAFESASPEMKSDWDKIVAAHAARDYATVVIACRKLLAQSALAPEQRTAITDTMTAVNNQMMDAVQRGDTNAIKAFQEVGRHWRD